MSSPPRILMTADTIGGIWSYAIELIEGLCRKGAQVGLATLGAPLDASQRAQCRRIPGLDVFESRYRLEWMDDPWQDVARSGEWLLWLADRLRPDVVHLNTYSHGALPWQRPVVVVSHSCVTSWWHAVHDEPPPPRYLPYQRAVRSGLLAASTVVAPSRSMLRALERSYGPLPDARVIHNGIELAEFLPASKQPFVLGAGRLWDGAKNVEALARVAAELAWPVRLAGATALSAAPPLRYEGIELLGQLGRSELCGHYASASIFAHPARYEPFGLAPLEAAACGCALVLGDIDSLREIWGDAATYVPPDDTDCLRDALTGLIGSEALRRTLAARARHRASRYSREAMLTAYTELYQQLMEPAWPGRGHESEPAPNAQPLRPLARTTKSPPHTGQPSVAHAGRI